jgi:AraC-like DNA-binding protein
MACLLPPGELNAIEAIPRANWEFCWVCYQLPSEQRPIADVTSAVMAPFEPLPLNSAIQGLIYECSRLAQPTLIQTWTDLIHAYVRRFPLSQQSDQPDGLGWLWERVARQPGEAWTLMRLAREAGYCSEHLRRLCRWQLGRSPVQHVTYLRLRRAAQLLATTEHTVEAIAHEVGYQSSFVFSNAFTKWIGWRPSDYRRKQHEVVSDVHPGVRQSPVDFEQLSNQYKPTGLCIQFMSAKSRQGHFSTSNI